MARRVRRQTDENWRETLSRPSNSSSYVYAIIVDEVVRYIGKGRVLDVNAELFDSRAEGSGEGRSDSAAFTKLPGSYRIQGGANGVSMKFILIASALLAAAVSSCGTLSVPGTPEAAASLNGFRASHGLNQLRTDGTLAALASEHAADMARRDSLDHDGFMTYRGPRGARAENVAYGCNESACVIQQWVNSSGHRKNMLIPGLTRYGFASATSPSGKKYWALLVGE
jgi:Cysteine-rich secretory protein family